MKINAIATGKKKMSFLEYEAVVKPVKNMNVMTSVNIVRQGKILVKIKTNVLLDKYNVEKLELIIEQLITDYIIGRETNITDQSQFQNSKLKKASAKQAKARTEAANDLFSMYKL